MANPNDVIIFVNGSPVIVTDRMRAYWNKPGRPYASDEEIARGHYPIDINGRPIISDWDSQEESSSDSQEESSTDSHNDNSSKSSDDNIGFTNSESPWDFSFDSIFVNLDHIVFLIQRWF